MLTVNSPGSGATTGERSHSQIIQLPFTTEFNMLPKSSPRFGALSHHSFFSRHNPHPHRVRHIQGLNGRPICMVTDDWFGTSSLFPHPLLKSHVLKKAAKPAFAFPPAKFLYGANRDKSISALFSDAWRDELKELTAKVCLSSQAQKDKNKNQPEEQFVRRKTQYSADTGRIIPPLSRSYHRQSFSQHRKYPQPFQDQELTVLELLCQILQTDSFSTVQQWLLLAGPREKDLVMGMISRALEGVDLAGRNQQNFQQLQAFRAFQPGYGPSFNQPLRNTQRTSSNQVNKKFSDDKPERIGDAEVFEVHAGAQDHLQDSPLQYSEST